MAIPTEQEDPEAATPSPDNAQFQSPKGSTEDGDEDDDTEERALIDSFNQEIKIPPDLDKWFTAFDYDREYVNNRAMLTDAEDAVGTNHILRNQWVLQSQIYAKDPECAFEAMDQIWPDTPPVTDPLTGMVLVPPMPGQPPPELDGLARTLDILVKQLLKENRFSSRLKGAIQDVETNALVFLKVNQQEDYERDPIGRRRNNDQQGNFAMFAWLSAQKASGDIQDGDAKAQRLKDLEVLVRGYIAQDLRDQVANAPKPPQAPMLPGDATGPALPPPALPPPLANMGAPLPGAAPVLPEAIPGTPAAPPAGGLGAAMAPAGPPAPPLPGPLGAATPPVPPPMPDPRLAQADAIEAPGSDVDISAMVPQVAKWIGTPIDFVMPEDIRIDWRITRPEDIYDSRRIHHRVKMDEDEFAAKYKLTPEEMQKIPRANGKTPDGLSNTTSGRDPEQYTPDMDVTTQRLSKTVNVWETWDKQTNTVYVWVIGYKTFLQNYVPTVVWRNWFPFLPFIFNRVTGRFVGISSTTLQRPAQEEINLFRTHDRHAKKASFPRILIKRGLFRRGEKQRYKNSLPYEVIEVDSPDEISKALYEAKPIAYDPKLYSTEKAEFDLQRMAGVSLSAGGAVSDVTATDALQAQQGSDQLSQFKQATIEQLVADVGTAIADIAIQIMPEENVKAICGPGAIWPEGIDRETLYRKLHLSVRAGSTGRPDSKERLAVITQAIQIAGPILGLRAKGPAILDEIFRDAGVNLNLSKYFELAPPPPPPGMGAPPGGGAPGPGQGGGIGSTPASGKPMGAGKPPGAPPGGAPPMNGPPKTIQNIPNHPQ